MYANDTFLMFVSNISHSIHKRKPHINPYACLLTLVCIAGDGEMEDSVVLAEGETIEGSETVNPQEAKIERSHLIVWQVAPS